MAFRYFGEVWFVNQKYLPELLGLVSLQNIGCQLTNCMQAIQGGVRSILLEVSIAEFPKERLQSILGHEYAHKISLTVGVNDEYVYAESAKHV